MYCQSPSKMVPFHDFSLFAIYFLNEDRRGFQQHLAQWLTDI